MKNARSNRPRISRNLRVYLLQKPSGCTNIKPSACWLANGAIAKAHAARRPGAMSYDSLNPSGHHIPNFAAHAASKKSIVALFSRRHHLTAANKPKQAKRTTTSPADKSLCCQQAKTNQNEYRLEPGCATRCIQMTRTSLKFQLSKRGGPHDPRGAPLPSQGMYIFLGLKTTRSPKTRGGPLRDFHCSY